MLLLLLFSALDAVVSVRLKCHTKCTHRAAGVRARIVSRMRTDAIRVGRICIHSDGATTAANRKLCSAEDEPLLRSDTVHCVAIGRTPEADNIHTQNYVSLFVFECVFEKFQTFLCSSSPSSFRLGFVAQRWTPDFAKKSASNCNRRRTFSRWINLSSDRSVVIGFDVRRPIRCIR